MPNQQAGGSLFERTMTNLRSAWRDIAQRTLSSSGTLSVKPDLPDEDLTRLRRLIAECLENRGGEVSARARAAELGRSYLGLSPLGRRRFRGLLAKDFGVDRDRLRAAIAAYEAVDEAPATIKAETALRDALVAPRLQLLRQLTTLPEGFKFLVDMRAELLADPTADSVLAGLDQDLKTLFAPWFDIGLLTLDRITWQSPALLLEKLIAYEAVHEIRSWDDLKNRLDSDRRCYAFFHPRMPNEPLIFVEVALTTGMAGSIQELLDEKAPRQDPRNADAAIFYSISNAQKGLRGISFGNFLIKQVIDDLSRDLPQVKTLATLSPIPGYRAWLERKLADGEPNLLTRGEHARLRAISPDRGAKGGLKGLLEQPDWHKNPEVASVLETPLMRLAARYLVLEKTNGGAPVDSVAFPSDKRRTDRAAQLAGRCLPQGLAAIGWHDGELPLPPWRHRGQS